MVKIIFGITYFVKIVLYQKLNIPKPSFMMLFSIFLRNNGSS